MDSSKLGHEMLDDPIFKFSNTDRLSCNINLQDEEKFNECLEEVFDLDKVLNSASFTNL